jgi:S-adenosylmethionine-diacylglycerol 3-amino-3-carboxypropyl transferase
LKADLKKIFSSTSLEEQKEKYVGIERKIFSPFFQWLTSRHTVLTMAGVPRAQRNLIQADNPGGVKSFILNSLKHVFTKIPLQDNYFWHVYLFGKYTRDCCPNYLKPENFETLKKKVNKISTYSQTITSFLTENPGTYSHFILLDHLDWLAYHNPEAMREEWEIMLKNSAPGTKFLLRSAANHLKFIPDFVHDAIDFSNNETLIQHNLDRVGTYGSVHLGIVK